MIAAWFLVSPNLSLPLLLYDKLGEDPVGFCGAKKFTSVGWLIYYELSLVFVFFFGLLITAIYYYRLANWLKRQQTTVNKEEMVKFTRELMYAMRVVTVLPAIAGGPVVCMTGGQMLLSSVPMWVSRLLVLPNFVTSCANPWLTITLVRPFQQRFYCLIGKLKHMICKSEKQTTQTVVRKFQISH